MSHSNTEIFTCCRCGQQRTFNELNGLISRNGVWGDWDDSHAHCRRLADCDSAESTAIVDWMMECIEGLDRGDAINDVGPGDPLPDPAQDIGCREQVASLAYQSENEETVCNCHHPEETAATVDIVIAEAFLDLVSQAAPEAQSVIVVPLQVSELPENFSDYLQCLLSPTVLHIRSGHPIQEVPPLAPSLGSASVRIRPLGSPSHVVDCEDNNQ